MQSSRQNRSLKKIEVIKRNLTDINEKNSMLKKSTSEPSTNATCWCSASMFIQWTMTIMHEKTKTKKQR